MKIFVINLARRPDRMLAITEDLKKHGITFERIDAVDGKSDPTVRQNRLPLLAFLYGKGKHTDGQIACLLSHRKIWQMMIEKKIEQALILEDDAMIKSWDNRILSLNIVELGLDALRLGANQESAGLAATQPEREILQNRKLVIGELWGSVATIITLSGAKKMMHHQYHWFPADHFHTFAKAFRLRYAIISPLIWSISNSQSDIATPSNDEAKSGKWVLKFTKPIRKYTWHPLLCAALNLKSRIAENR
jgi:GR25 family glycosyltransferase involved in LPS biosynthesis